MIKCRECEKDISHRAVACPHCGCPSKKAGRQFIRRWLVGLVIGLCTFSVLHAPFHYALDQLVNFLPVDSARKKGMKDDMDKFFHKVFSDPREEGEEKKKHSSGGKANRPTGPESK